MLTVEVSDQQNLLPIRAALFERAVSMVLADHQLREATVSVVVVDNETIHRLNRQYLDHDYPTDVLSFPLSQEETRLDGEVIVSAEMAQQRCAEFGWSALCELLWYVLHGTLHLCGYDDQTPSQREKMEQLQQHYLQQLEADRQLSPGCEQPL